MIHIIYSENGEAVNDFQCETIFQSIKENSDVINEWNFSTSNIFARIRLGIASGEIPESFCCFIFEEKYLYLNRFGAIMEEWPDGFCDYENILSEKIMRTALNKRKNEK